MKLFTSKERDLTFKREKEDMRLKASALSAEFSQLLKSYNLTKDDLENFYIKNASLRDWEDKLNFKEENLKIRENNARIKEKEVLELRDECNAILEKILKLEEKLVARTKAITDREIKFNSFKELQESVLGKDKQKLRDWLELERKKFKICQNNLLD